MLVYPEIESWNKFYPSEIFIRRDSNDSNLILLRRVNIAKPGV